MGAALAKRISILLCWLGLAVSFHGSFSCTQPDEDTRSLIASSQGSLAPPNGLPGFEARDINNQRVSDRSIQGTIALIYFVDLRQRDQIDVLNGIYNEFGDYTRLSITVFTKGPIRSNDELLCFSRIHIIPDLSGEYRRIFHVPSCCERFLLYDETGKLLSSGASRWDNEHVIRASLKKVLEHQVFTARLFLGASDNMWSLVGSPEASRNIVEGKPCYYLFAFIRSFCRSCSSGLIIQELNELQKVAKNQLHIVLYLTSDFNTQDIINLREQLKIEYDIQIAPPSLGTKWDELVADFGPLVVTDILILTDQEGRVFSSAFPECDCYRDFYRLASETAGD